VERLTYHVFTDSIDPGIFLCTYRSFCTPDELLDLIMMRYQLPKLRFSPKDIEDKYKEKENKIHLKVLNTCKTWIDKHFYDFKDDPSLLIRLQEFIKTSTSPPSFSTILGQQIQKQLDRIPIVSEVQPPAPKGPRVTKPAHLCSCLDFDQEEIARQICLIDHELFVEIRPAELLNGLYNNREFIGYSVNYYRFMSRIDKIANIIVNEYSQAQEITKKAQTVIKWLTVLDHLVKMGNWHSIAGVLLGLDQTLQFDQNAWNAVPQLQRKIFTELKQNYDPNTNYPGLKEKIQQTPPPYLPFLGLMLQTIDQIEKQNPDITQNMINFARHAAIGEILLKQLLEVQKSNFVLTPVSIIQDWLRLNKGKDTDILIEAESAPRQLPPPVRSTTGSGSGGSMSHRTSVTSGPNLVTDKGVIMQLLKTDKDFRDEIKNIIRESVRSELLSFKEQYFRPIDSDRIISEQFQGCTKTKWTQKDEEGIVFGNPGDIEVDLIQNNEVTYIYEVKSIVSIGDIFNILRVGKFFRSRNQNIPRLRCVFIANSIDPRAKLLAEASKIDIIYAEK